MPREITLTALDSARERIGRRLQAAIDRLEGDIALVEFWAGALDGFARPVPNYDGDSGALGRYILSAQSGGEGSRGDRDPDPDERA
jgi:hypothetical protein